MVTKMEQGKKIVTASFRVPSTLRTGIGPERVQVGKWFALTYARSMNIPVALESRSAFTALVSPVSVVWSSMFSLRDLWGSSVLSNMSTMKQAGRHRSHRDLRVGTLAGVFSNDCMAWGSATGSSILGILSTDRVENWL